MIVFSNIMYFNIFFFITSAMLINRFECSHHRRSKLHRRQDQGILQPYEQVPVRYYSLQEPLSQFPVANPRYPPPFPLNRLPTGNDGFLNENLNLPYALPSDSVVPDYDAVLNNKARLPPPDYAVPPQYPPILYDNSAVSHSLENEFLSKKPSALENAEVKTKAENVTEDTMLPTLTSALMDESRPAFSDPKTPKSVYPESIAWYSKPINVGSRRRRKNTGENSDGLLKIFEKEKELFELSEITEHPTKTDATEQNGHSIGNDDTDGSTTLIPLPKGMQLKTVTKYQDSVIRADINISSSTQTILSQDNNTEVEKVVEMEMEKKTEDEKGNGKGYEQVKIIEKEKIKPITRSKVLKAHRRKKKHHRNRFVSHHRSKRSKLSTDEIPRLKTRYNKLTHRFLSVIKRKERVAEPNTLMPSHLIPDFPEMNRNVITEKPNQMRENWIYDRSEIDDFMKFFLNEMKKFRNTRENKMRFNVSHKRICKECSRSELVRYEPKKLKKNTPFPEHMNVIMSLNMTWDSKTKNRVDKSIKALKEYSLLTSALENTTTSTKFTNELKTATAVKVNENQNARFLIAVLFFSAITCIFTVSTLVLPKLCKLIKLNRTNSGNNKYKLYDIYPKNRTKELEHEHLFSLDYPELEWQSENGDWLSDKEAEIKPSK